MASCSVALRRSAEKDIEALPPKDRKRVIARIALLAAEPRPQDCKRLSGEEKYRLRQGDCRILYEIVDDELIVTVVKVAHRRDVYR